VNALRGRYVRKNRMLLTTLNTDDSRIHVEMGMTKERYIMRSSKNKRKKKLINFLNFQK
jgi:hypothetical protein